MNQKVELLAPAGNPEGFYGAIHAGADAVYLAGSRFGARAYADNFTTEELIACIRYAHIWGRRVYLTVNTLVKESEFNELFTYLAPFYEAGLDGVIVQDIGVFCFIRRNFPDMELHVSTQMTLTGKHGAALLKKMGAVRIVPARELSLSELVEIKQHTGLEIETFIHGAMCYCYSGQCLFSSILGGRSGNRGRCAQPCRLPYRVKHAGRTVDECYPLSLKDMCTIEHIPELIEAGIDSFKIEGRMKKPEYAAGVTAIYRKYIDKFYAGEDYKVSRKDLDALNNLYIRSERQDGYYYRHNGKDMVTLESPSYSGTDEGLLESIRARYLTCKPQINLDIQASFRIGEAAHIVLTHSANKAIQIEAYGEIVSDALKQPISEENIRKQLGKLGDTVFQAQDIQIDLDDNAFYPLKAINDLRRQAIVLLENLMIQENGLCVRRNTPIQSEEVVGHQPYAKGHMHTSVRTNEQLETVLKELTSAHNHTFCMDRVYLESDCIYNAIKNSDRQLFEICNSLYQIGCLPVIALPPIIRQRDKAFLAVVWDAYMQYSNIFGGFMVRSMDGLGFLEHQKFTTDTSHAIYADAGFYIWNRESMKCLSKDNDLKHILSTHISGFCMPYELKAAEQRHLLKNSILSDECDMQVEKIVYGRIPLMLTANCIVNTVNGCSPANTDQICYLTDRYKKNFPVLRNCIHCMNTIYNSLPLSLHAEMSKWQNDVDLRLDFTIESRQETEQILHYFLTGAKGDSPFDEYTTGHEKRGAE